MDTVTSDDGTPIAFDLTGDGPPVILIGGAFNDRSTVTSLAAALAPEVTAVAYDRRGRGASGDNSGGSLGATDAITREIEDLAALVKRMGGSASLFGHSSGAQLAIEAAARGLAVDKLAVYEPPYVVGGARPLPPADAFDRLRSLIRDGQRDAAVTLFLTELAAVPAQVVEQMSSGPLWPWFVGLAHTLPYDAAVAGPELRLPTERLATVNANALAITGSQSPAWMAAATKAVAETIPGARYLTLDGHDHGVLNQPQALRPILLDLLLG